MSDQNTQEPEFTSAAETESDGSRLAALAAATSALQPIAALLLDVGISHDDFARMVQRAYVSEAEARQRALGTRPSISRIAAATGMSRQEVSQIIAASTPSSQSVTLSLRPADRILAAWNSDPDFLLQNGSPKPLDYIASRPSFADLVKKHGPDIPPRALLKELLASNLISEPAPDVFLPIRPSSSTRLPRKEAIRDFGAKINALGFTLLKNLRSLETRPLFESMTITDNLPASLSAKVSRELERRCRTFSQAIERFLLDQTDSTQLVSEDRSRVEFGVMVAVVEKPQPEAHLKSGKENPRAK
jgi:hypothetical protein